MYVYLQEEYSDKDKEILERKLERSYGLANAIKETSMKMKDLLKEDVLSVKFNNLPDDVDLDAITVDIVKDDASATADESQESEEESQDTDKDAETSQEETDKEEASTDADPTLELSESVLRSELRRIKELSEKSKNDQRPSKISEAKRKLMFTRKRLLEARRSNENVSAAALQHRLAYKNYKKLTESSGSVFTKRAGANEVSNTSSGRSLESARNASKVKIYARKLAEANLLNAKLIQVNKFLRLEGVTKEQQLAFVDRIDEARDLREVRLISENLYALLKKSQKRSPVNESVVGSSSRTSKSGAASSEKLNESLETSRWELLAGIK